MNENLYLAVPETPPTTKFGNLSASMRAGILLAVFGFSLPGAAAPLHPARRHCEPGPCAPVKNASTGKKTAPASPTAGAGAGTLDASPSAFGRLREVRSAVEDKGHVELTGYASLRYSVTAPSASVLTLSQLHLEAIGQDGSRLRWKLELQANNQPHWINAAVSALAFRRNWLTVGQFKLPFSQENLAGSTTIETINRPDSVTNLVPGREHHGDGHELGAGLDGDLVRRGRQAWLTYSVGAFNGRTINSPGGARPRVLVARLQSQPWAGLILAADYARGTTPGLPLALARSDAEIALHAGGWNLQGEFLQGRNGSLHHRGGYAQVAYRFLPQWDAIVLADHYRPNLRNAAGQEDSLLGGLNWYLTRTLRLQINEGARRTRPLPAFKPYFLSQLQLRFR